MDSNYDSQTVAGFGDEWTRFDHSTIQRAELEQSFDLYFSIFPWEALPTGAIGFDLGCGSGRWAKLVAEKVGKLHCIDASPAALAVARKNLSSFHNVEFFQASVEELPLAKESMDFGYSLGVLHHIPDTFAGLKTSVEKLKPGAPFLVYIYYAFDNKPGWFRPLWTLTEPFRIIISKLPFPTKLFICQVIAALVYYPLARFAWMAEKIVGNVDSFPLSWYRNLSFYAMRNDALDRFGTNLEQRFTKEQIRQMMEESGLERIAFSDRQPYWCAVGYKK
jgi:ubiquinone/menaquinone biosynthesis C-methylase UbiE